MKPQSRRSDASDVAIHLRSQVCLLETPNNSNLPSTMMHQIAFSFVESSFYSTASKTKIPPQPSQAESKEVESAVNLFQFEQGFQRNHLEAGNLNKFAKGLNIYFPSHLLKKNKDICFSTTLFYPCKACPPGHTKQSHIMQKYNFNLFHHRGTCTRSSSFPNIQDNTSHF